ncbi:hypothetical protein [Streptomyces natalensis]|uniref:Uncharacterized protein n=1 Tax=Streptomyces natalensis ATCC 27448 TaxID=1240678 RepID=A0A0D7CKW1_9ACTN|nr:hypothetical protein [Streptomyces natalensis]KIZ16854.1 hypothetical protein SNA_17835 [Streptomyces natalensis ATCC 27448]
MSRYSRARLNQEADRFEAEAKRYDEAARDGEQAAKNPQLGDAERQVASRAVPLHRRNARDFRVIAAALHAGEIPDGVQLD